MYFIYCPLLKVSFNIFNFTYSLNTPLRPSSPKTEKKIFLVRPPAEFTRCTNVALKITIIQNFLDGVDIVGPTYSTALAIYELPTCKVAPAVLVGGNPFLVVGGILWAWALALPFYSLPTSCSCSSVVPNGK